MKKLFSILLCAVIFTIPAFQQVTAQVAGQIISAATPATNPMDPDGDGYITSTGVAFTSASNEPHEAELDWRQVFDGSIYQEPHADPGSGGSCGQTDIVEGEALGAGSCAYYAYDSVGDYFLFRIRVSTNPTGNFGYSILLDTDDAYGAGDDPNYVAGASTNKLGNPGFEIEIRLATGGGGGGTLYVDNVDGTTTGTNITSYSTTSNAQRAYSADQDIDCGGTYAIFMDFFIPRADLGVTPTQPLRMVPATSSNGASILGATASDIGGVDDSSFPTYEDIITGSITNQGSGSALLPVELIYTKANWVGSNAAEIKWATASEKNSSHFLIQRSQGDDNFITIGTIDAAGTSNLTKYYSFIDMPGNAAVYYYRLKQVDYDGSFTNSPIFILSSEKSASSFLNIYPNPIEDNHLNFETNSTIRRVEVYNYMGTLLYEEETQNRQSIELPSDISSGSYFIRFISYSGQVYNRQLIVK